MQRDEIRAAAVRQLGLDIDFSLLDKKVRMLGELAESSPVVNGKLTNEIVEALEPGTEYVIVERQQMNVLLEGIKLRVFLQPDGLGGRRRSSTGGTSRVTGDGQARICERLGAKFPGPTRQQETEPSQTGLR